MEESLSKFMAESPKRHEENSNIIKEIRASTNAAIKTQGALIKILEIQIGKMSKVLQERGFGSLPSSTKTNPRDQVKSISTTKADFSDIRRMEYGPYSVSGPQPRYIFLETIPFPRRLYNYCCDDLKEARGVKILDAYDHNLPQKEISRELYLTFLGLGILSHTRLTIELADRTIKQPRSIAENVLVRIGKFVFLIDFIILEIPEDDDVLLIIG
nr:hypothetical protein [Tanacetum cinerariifolium]